MSAREPGIRVGPYQLISPIGEGGMGEVWKANDTRLDRTVAVKFVKGQFSERFQTEARAISALNSPNICALYDVGEQDGEAFLVMEYIEGKTLSGPLPLEKALEYAKQILDALAAAHRKGIVHRDLKPANILVTKSGIKLLDFGLARVQARAAAAGAPGQTVTLALTAAHQIVGTPQYMAPEQIEGREADPRTDIFAFGLVLYEMLTGRRAFEGKTTASTMAAILEREAPPLSQSLPDIPQRFERVLQTCLAKDPEDRWQNAMDLRRELDWLELQPSSVTAAPPASGFWKVYLPWALAAFSLAGVAFLLWRSRQPATATDQPVAFSITEGAPYRSFPNSGSMAVSPDGRMIVFLGVSASGQRMVYLRDLSSQSVREIKAPQPERVTSLFWSPDSKSIGWMGAGSLHVMDLANGSPRIVADVPNFNARGATWGSQGDIVFASQYGPLQKVRASGGPVEDALKGSQEPSNTWPWFLPNGKDLIFIGSTQSRAALYAATVGTDRRKEIMTINEAARYASGRLLFVEPTSSERRAELRLLSQPFDVSSWTLRGDPKLLTNSVGSTIRYSLFAVGGDTLAYTPGSSGIARTAWHDISGKTVEPTNLSFDRADLSYDGRRLVYGRDSQIWIRDLNTGADTRLTFNSLANINPSWSPDGNHVAFFRHPPGSGLYDVVRKRADGAGAEELLVKEMKSLGAFQFLQHLPDGSGILYGTATPRASQIYVYRFAERKGGLLSESVFTWGHPKVSPDGKWLAYASTENQRSEVFVRDFPGLSSVWQVSLNGGGTPRWRRDGKALYFLGPNGELNMVDVSVTGNAFRASSPRRVLPALLSRNSPWLGYIVSNDGKRFLIQTPESSTEINVLLNWQNVSGYAGANASGSR